MPCVGVLVVFGNYHGYGTIDALFERNERFGGNYALNFLNVVVEQIHKVLIIARVKFYKHGVGTCGEVALHNFGNFFEFFSYAFYT